MKKMLYLGLCLLLTGCRISNPTSVDQNFGGLLENAQKDQMQKEKIEIQSFLERVDWKMNRLNTGVYYEIYQSRNGVAIQTGDKVDVRYQLRLLSGKVVGHIEAPDFQSWILGKTPLPSGLEQVLPLLKKGDKARILIPSHLAYGFSGDGENIPPRATLLYDLEVVQVYIKK